MVAPGDPVVFSNGHLYSNFADRASRLPRRAITVHARRVCAEVYFAFVDRDADVAIDHDTGCILSATRLSRSRQIPFALSEPNSLGISA